MEKYVKLTISKIRFAMREEWLQHVCGGRSASMAHHQKINWIRTSQLIMNIQKIQWKSVCNAHRLISNEKKTTKTRRAPLGNRNLVNTPEKNDGDNGSITVATALVSLSNAHRRRTHDTHKYCHLFVCNSVYFTIKVFFFEFGYWAALIWTWFMSVQKCERQNRHVFKVFTRNVFFCYANLYGRMCVSCVKNS